MIAFKATTLFAESATGEKPNRQLSPFQTTQTDSAVRGGLAMHYSNLKTSNLSMSVFSFAASIQKMVSEKMAIGGVLGQAFSGEGQISSLFTSTKISAEFALTGSLDKVNSKTLYENHPIMEAKSYYSGGWRGAFYLSQYFLNAEKAAVPFSGPALSIGYDFPSESNRYYGSGVMMESMSNGQAKLNSIGIFVQVGFY